MSRHIQWRCIFGLHPFEKWQDGDVYEIERQNLDFGAGVLDGVPYWVPSGHKQVQTRTCPECGLKESRTLRV